MSCGFSADELKVLDPLGLTHSVDGRIAWRCPQCPDADLCHLAMPYMRKQKIGPSLPAFTVFNHTRKDGSLNTDKGVLFFVDDARFSNILAQPWAYCEWLSQYPLVATPDVSMYLDMSVAEQFMAAYKSRLVGAIWQHLGMTVIPTISWAGSTSFLFCFKGVEEGSVVAVSTLGTRKQKRRCEFMLGFTAMVEALKPAVVVCYDRPYAGMDTLVDLQCVQQVARSKSLMARQRQVPGQLSLGF
jgi:hypothetical protein